MEDNTSPLDNNLQRLQEWYGGFDITREQIFDIIKSENFVFKNNTLNEDMLNVKQ